ncbi:unnamed protein product [Phyllotreta striolata]|uniref:Uncharacterized protein n=1 Tax=Phyllotreta striolata TaxID=444603 RepID=A0A9N9XNB5_PHYSR|nr:unnamed protein product [Phyllotreta striolata]
MKRRVDKCLVEIFESSTNQQKMKAVLLTFILCLVISELYCSLEHEWNQFKVTYNKKYKTSREEQRRFKAFKKNIREITNHNTRFKKGLETFEKGLTVFADLTKNQFDKKYGFNLFKPKTMIVYTSTHRHNKSASTEYFDWREKGAVTPIKDQGICGSCWIFSAIGMLEGYNLLKTGQLISLSEQNVVDCFSSSSCKGGFPVDAIHYVKENGISTAADYPYRQTQDKCKGNVPRITIDFEGFNTLNVTEDGLKKLLIKFGPLGISLYVSGVWRLYKRGVWYQKECSDNINHAVILVGYGTENGEDYWLIKNSWGKSWGEDGYIKIARNRHENYCGLTKDVMYIY